MPSESERLRSSWIANSAAWCDAVREERLESRRLVTNAAIVAAVLERNPRCVLDLGCGEGWLARTLSAHGISVTGVDASAPLIDAAQSLGGGSYLTLSYEEIIRNPSAAGAGYDVIVANFSMLDDRASELARALRTLLASEGALIVQTVHPFAAAGDSYVDGWRTETFSAFPGNWPEAMPWYFRTVGSWFHAFTTAGYEIAEVREPSYPERPMPASMIFVCRSLRLVV